MKNLALFVLNIEMPAWLESFIEWLKINYFRLALCTALVVIIFLIINHIFTKKALKKASETKILCNGIFEREGMKTFRKNISVTINKETGMYYFKYHGNWYKLRKIHRDEIKESMNDKHGPSFHIPIKK